jgi:hypothetical protein
MHPLSSLLPCFMPFELIVANGSFSLNMSRNIVYIAVHLSLPFSRHWALVFIFG